MLCNTLLSSSLYKLTIVFVLQSNNDILNFATTEYDVNFPMFSKIDVIGENAHPLWKFLAGKLYPMAIIKRHTITIYSICMLG